MLHTVDVQYETIWALSKTMRAFVAGWSETEWEMDQ